MQWKELVVNGFRSLYLNKEDEMIHRECRRFNFNVLMPLMGNRRGVHISLAKSFLF